MAKQTVGILCQDLGQDSIGEYTEKILLKIPDSEMSILASESLDLPELHSVYHPFSSHSRFCWPFNHY